MSQSKVAASAKNQSDGNSPVPPEVQTHLPQTHLPLRTQDTGRTEYVAPVRGEIKGRGLTAIKGQVRVE